MSGIAEYPATGLDNFLELYPKYAEILKQNLILQFMISMISREIEFITMKEKRMQNVENKNV